MNLIDYLPILLSALIALTIGLSFVLWYWLKRTPKDTGQFSSLNIRTVNIEDWSIRYHQSGQGPNLLLIHGIGANLYCWRQLIPILNTKYKVLAIDLPGFGQSSMHSHMHYGLDDQVERVSKLLDQLKIEKTFVVGNSMGGNLSLWFATRFPNRTLGVCAIAPATESSLVLLPLDSWLWLSHPISFAVNHVAAKWAHQRTVSNKGLVDHERLAETLKTYRRNPNAIRSFLSATSTIRDPRLNHDLKDLKCKIQILWGTEDKLVPLKVIKKLTKILPKHEYHFHQGGGHHLQEDDPEWVAKKIDDFFSTID